MDAQADLRNCCSQTPEDRFSCVEAHIYFVLSIMFFMIYYEYFQCVNCLSYEYTLLIKSMNMKCVINLIMKFRLQLVVRGRGRGEVGQLLDEHLNYSLFGKYNNYC